MNLYLQSDDFGEITIIYKVAISVCRDGYHLNEVSICIHDTHTNTHPHNTHPVLCTFFE